jgi:phage gp36-like protein
VPYCQPADVRNVLNPLGGIAPPASAAGLSDEIMSDLIDDAETFVNGWLADRYEVPFADGEVPDLALKVTRNIAAFLAVQAAAGSQEIPAAHPAQLRYNSAVATLRALAGGQMTLALPATDGANPAVGTGQTPETVVNVTTGPLFCPGDFSLGPERWAEPGRWSSGMPF